MQEESQKGCLIIGEGVTLTGNIAVPQTLRISGSIDGDVVARELFIEESGVVRGKINAELVDVQGEVHQDLVATKYLFIRSMGKVNGNISYLELEIEKGGGIAGTLTKIESNSYSY